MIDTKHVPLPVGGSITEKAQKSALNGEFTNLAEFIPCNNVPESSDMETVVTQSGSLYMSAHIKRVKSKILSQRGLLHGLTTRH